MTLADDRTAAVGKDHGRTGLDHSGALCGHNIDAEIELLHRDADYGDQQRGGKANQHDLEVGGSVCGINRPVHGTLQRTNLSRFGLVNLIGKMYDVGPSRYVKNVTEKAILLRARSSAQGLNFAEVKGETAEQIDLIF